MPTILVSLQNIHGVEVMLMPLSYRKAGKKYVYGPKPNGTRRKPRDMKPTVWRKLVDGFTDLFSMIREKV